MAEGSSAAALTDVPALVLLDLRGDAGDPAFVAAIAGVLGSAPPTMPNTVAAAGAASLLWLGPDQWLVVAPASDIAPRLETALGNLHHSLLDISAGRLVLELAGPEARTVLAKGMSLDLHVSVFKTGSCAQSALARVPVVLQQLDETPRYRLYVRRSFAPYIVAWLAAAMREFTDPA
jgi:sarcosine oxidase subunit gamma